MQAVLDAFELPRWSRAAFVGVLILCAEMFAPTSWQFVFRIGIVIASVLAPSRERNALWFAQLAIELSASVHTDGWSSTTSTYASSVTPIAIVKLAHYVMSLH